MGYGRHSEGYLRATTVAGRAEEVYEHRRVWSEAHGPIPDGFHVHHIDGDRSNNALENLRAVSFAEHRRLHSNYQPDGLTKRCGCCGAVLALSDFPRRSDSPSGYKSDCRECYRVRNAAYMRAQRAGGAL